MPLRVLIICTRFGVGGIARHAVDLGSWLRAQGHIVTFAGTPGEWLGPEKEKTFVELDTHGISGEQGTGPLDRVRSLAASGAKLRTWLRKNPVDIIHAHESAPALAARLACLGRRTPIILTFHGAEPSRMSSYARIANLTATRVISVSRAGAEALHELGLAPGKAINIGLGVKPMPPVEPARIASLRRELLGGQDGVLCVTIARLCFQKAIDTLIDVSVLVKAERPDIRFVVVGDGPLEQDLRRHAERVGADAVRFVGASNEAHLYLRAADIFMLTSRWEALPFTIVEAFQAGTPVIATDCGGVGELVDSTVGRIAPIGDAASLAAAVLEIAGDKTLRANLAQAAAARARDDRFQPAVVNAKIEAFYRQVLASRGRQGAGPGREPMGSPSE